MDRDEGVALLLDQDGALILRVRGSLNGVHEQPVHRLAGTRLHAAMLLSTASRDAYAVSAGTARAVRCRSSPGSTVRLGGYFDGMGIAATSADPRIDERSLWRRLGAGDGLARDELVARYVRLAHRLARRYARTSESLEDLEQVACVGLVLAVDRFDAGRGTNFSTFAVPTILGELRRHFRDRTWVLRVPRDVRDAAAAVERTGDELAAELGRSPSVTEIARATGLAVEQVIEAREAAIAYHCDSLDRRVYADEGEGVTLLDRIGARDDELRRAEAGVLFEQLAARSLSRRDREVLRMRFQDDLLQREIAARVGISQMQVSRILRDSLQRLRLSAG